LTKLGLKLLALFRPSSMQIRIVLTDMIINDVIKNLKIKRFLQTENAAVPTPCEHAKYYCLGFFFTVFTFS